MVFAGDSWVWISISASKPGTLAAAVQDWFESLTAQHQRAGFWKTSRRREPRMRIAHAPGEDSRTHCRVGSAPILQAAISG